jgi:hypothetical protein
MFQTIQLYLVLFFSQAFCKKLSLQWNALKLNDPAELYLILGTRTPVPIRREVVRMIDTVYLYN